MMKRMVAFDLDGTLADSKRPLDDGVARSVSQLLDVVDVAVISGGDWPQFERQVAARLPARARLGGLWLMPTTGTKLYRHADGWTAVYAELFSEAEKTDIRVAFDGALRDAGLTDERTWGERLEDRGSQFTFSGLGQEAPLEAKERWDPDRRKRAALQTMLARALPNFSIRLGGTTSIDVTRSGIDKACALRRLAEVSGVAIAETLYIGDALYPGGNDEPALATGVDAIRVRDPAETMTAIAAIVACQGKTGSPVRSGVAPSGQDGGG